MQATFEWWRLLLLLGIFVFLAAAWYWANKGKINWKRFGKLPDRKIKVLEQNWISSHLTLYLVELEGERFLLARTQGSLSWQPLQQRPSSDKQS